MSSKEKIIAINLFLTLNYLTRRTSYRHIHFGVSFFLIYFHFYLYTFITLKNRLFSSKLKKKTNCYNKYLHTNGVLTYYKRPQHANSNNNLYSIKYVNYPYKLSQLNHFNSWGRRILFTAITDTHVGGKSHGQKLIWIKMTNTVRVI